MGPDSGGGSDLGGVGNSASEAPASTESNNEQPAQELSVEPTPEPTPAPDNKSQDNQAQPSPTPPLPTPLPSPTQLKPPMPQKDLFKLLMKKLIAELQKNLAKIKKRKKGKNSDEEEGAANEPVGGDPGQEMKLDKEMIQSLRKIADEHLKLTPEGKPDSLVARVLGEDLTKQLKEFAKDFLDRMEKQLDQENSKEQLAKPKLEPAKETHQQNDNGELPEAEIVNEQPEKETHQQNDSGELPEAEIVNEQPEKETHQQNDSGEPPEAEIINEQPKKETAEENHLGEPVEGGMTESQIIDAGQGLGSVLKDSNVQKELGVTSKEESAQMDDLGSDADSMQSSSLPALKKE